MRKPVLSLVLALVAGAICAGAARAGDWPQWRGPFHNGSADEKNLPTKWSDTENVLWKADLPGPSAATPIIVGDRIYVSSTQAGSKALLALCLSARNGKILWQKQVSTANGEPPSNTMASCSPVADGKRACFLYGNGDVAAFDLGGNLLWSRHLGEEYGRFSLKYGYSSSPLLYKDKLYIQVLRASRPYSWSGEGQWPTDSFLLALDTATGKTIWKKERKTDANAESKDAYTTPVLFKGPKGMEIVIVGGDYVTGSDPETGDELWRIGYDPRRNGIWRLIPSAVPGDGLVYATVPRGRNPLFAVPAGRSGEIPWTDIAWEFAPDTPDVCVPLLYQGRLYVLSDAGRDKKVVCLDPKTGKPQWEVPLENAVYRASPTGADGKIYCLSEPGDVTVLAAGGQPQLLEHFSMGEGPVQASMAAAGGRLYVRTSKRLWCIGK